MGAVFTTTTKTIITTATIRDQNFIRSHWQENITQTKRQIQIRINNNNSR